MSTQPGKPVDVGPEMRIEKDTEDLAEGTRAFSEKREPRFRRR